MTEVKPADDPAAPGNPAGLSTIEYCALLPRRRWSHEAKGKILYFPRTGICGVPCEMRDGGSWNVVVVKGDQTYPVGGYNLYVCADEIETALEVKWSPAEFVDATRREPDRRSPFEKVMATVPQPSRKDM